MKIYQALAQELARLRNLEENANGWYAIDAWETVKEDIEGFVKGKFPSGSGFDAGTKLDFDKTHTNRLVFTTSFHHMDEHGGYDGWTTHEVIITPDLAYGYNIRVTGINRNNIKDFILDTFGYIVNSDIEPGTISPVRPRD